ncbi:MAG: CCA tRNA nucleotidyltransferase, partial [Alphaproteobacteria bacterium]
MAENDTARHPTRSLAPPSLDRAQWLVRPETKRAFAALSGDTGATRAVGGAVRDALLGLPVSDVDLATTLPPEKVIVRARGAGLKAIPTGLEHGTVTIVADGTSFEVTTLRRDVETFGRKASVSFTEDWAEDAARRDFTLNALYAGADGTLFDPLGGYPDLAAGRVRFIGDPVRRISEDYLRILRFFRFNASYGRGALDAEGLSACVRERAGLRLLSAERVAAELKRLMVAPRAAEAVSVLFTHGLLCDILGCVPRLPRFERLVEVEAALGRAPSSVLRLAALAVFVPEDAKRLA